MIYYLDSTGRPTGEVVDRTMDFYASTGFIPRHITDIPPPNALPGHDVVFNGKEWIQFPIENDQDRI